MSHACVFCAGRTNFGGVVILELVLVVVAETDTVVASEVPGISYQQCHDQIDDSVEMVCWCQIVLP